MEKSLSEIMGFKSEFGEESTFNPINEIIAEHERQIGADYTIHQTLVKKKRNSANGFYYFYDGTFLGNYGTSGNVVICGERAFYKKNKIYSKDFYEFRKLEKLEMINEELNLKAFMATIKETENNGNKALPYNVKHGKLDTFTEKSYDKAQEDYAEHPYKDSKGSSPAGAYQMTNSTFKSQKNKNSKLVKDFGPNSQDYAVIEVCKDVGAYEFIIEANLDKAEQKLIKDQWGNTQFASLPGGGQEAKSMTMIKLKEMFKNNLANELNHNSNISLKIGKTIQ